MRLSTWLRSIAVAAGTVMIVASGAAPAMAASAEESIVGLDALDTSMHLFA